MNSNNVFSTKQRKDTSIHDVYINDRITGIPMDSTYIRIVNDGDVVLEFYCGQSENIKIIKKNLSKTFIPFSPIKKVPIIHTPFIKPLLKVMANQCFNCPPISRNSDRHINYIFRLSVLFIEYLSYKGCLTLEDIDKKLVRRFFERLDNGWESALYIKERVIEAREHNKITRKDLSIRTLSRLNNKDSFILSAVEVNRAITSNLYQKKSDISHDLIKEITGHTHNSPSTEKHFNAKLMPKGSFNKLQDIVRRLLLYSDSSIKIDYPYKGKDTARRTETVSVNDVARYANSLASLLSIEQFLRENSVEIRRQKDELQPIDINIFGKNYQVRLVKHAKTNPLKGEFAFPQLVKLYKLAVAGLVTLFTGFRAAEITDKYAGLAIENIEVDRQSLLTILERSHSKKRLPEEQSREKVCVGPVVGLLLERLQDFNCFYFNCQKHSIFCPAIELNGKLVDQPTILSETISTNPLRALFHLEGWKYPTPKELRRFFACMYYYQFDNPELLALANYLGHENTKTTEVYVTDIESQRVNFSIKKQIPIKILPPENDEELMGLLAEERDKKIRGMVLRALSGESRGGFRIRVLKIFRKLTEFVDFSQLDKETKMKMVDKISNHVLLDNYGAEPNFHNTCTNTLNAAGKDEALCYSSDGRIEHELASATKCFGCSFSHVEKQNVENIKLQRDHLKNELNKTNLNSLDSIFTSSPPPLVVMQKKQKLKKLEQIIKLYQVDFGDTH